MRRLLFLSLTLNALVLIAAVWGVIAGPRLVRNLVHELIIDVRHDQKASMFRETPVRPGAIVFLGNSLTEGGNWQELFPDHEVLNRGIGGDVATGVLARIDEVVRHQPSVLFLCIGTNDLTAGVERAVIVATVGEILDVLHTESPDTEVIVQSVPPVAPNVVFGHALDPILALNDDLRALCDARGLTYLDLHPILAGDDGHLRPDLTNDGLHLLGPAYLLWADAVRPFIDTVP